MVSIKSIVAFDLETTGLPSMEHNLTKITELSMAACEREHCINQTELPRVINKIVLSVNPFRKISFGASGISGKFFCTGGNKVIMLKFNFYFIIFFRFIK